MNKTKHPPLRGTLFTKEGRGLPLTVGLYIHIPFCACKCPYCDFYSVEFDDRLADEYGDAVIRALEGGRNHPGAARHPSTGGELSVDTIYFGGGTPSLFGADRILRILSAVHKNFDVAAGAEITIEANPASCTAGDFSALMRGGLNRISFGVQSLCDAELAALGRLHSADDAVRSIMDAHKAGFWRISADLMLGIPGQTRESLEASIDALTTLPIDHVSAYILGIAENTAFAREDATGLCPDEDEVAALYHDCVERLAARGFFQYEVSNFAKNNNVSRHNMKYWRCEAYLGIGASAHSYFGGQRFSFPPDFDAFITAGNPFTLCIPDGTGGGFEEYAMLRLRLAEGLNLGEVKALYSETDIGFILNRAKALGNLVEVDGNIIRLTVRGFLLSNAVIGELLG